VHGKRGVQRVTLEGVGQLDCDLLVTGFSQPSYEMQAQNGCAMELRGEPPIVWPTNSGRAPMVVVGEAAGWFTREAQAERSAQATARWLDGQSPAAPEWTRASFERVSPHDDAIVCLCEDVRVRDVRAAIADGYRDVELIKRHTGAGTGPCQGKLCHGALSHCLAESGLEVRLPTARPLVRPVPLACFAGRPDE
jgi:bacterioferritin-associated ferredoxin